MQDNLKVLKQALDTVRDRGAVYDTGNGGVEENFTRSAQIASLWLNRPITARDVALIMASVKIARTAVAPDHQDSFVDLVNYVSFGASFSGPKNGTGVAVGSSKPTPVSSDLNANIARPDLNANIVRSDLEVDNQRLSGPPIVGPKNAGQ